MKRTSIQLLLAAACTVTTMGAIAGTKENFNSRNNAPLGKVKALLQDQCWIFRNFEINRGGWNPGIDGDGAMVSGNTDASRLTAIYTPLVNTDGSLAVSFDYKFNAALSEGASSWIKLTITDANGNLVKELDQVEFKKINVASSATYTGNFNVTPGAYKIAVIYGGNAGATKIAIDNFNLNAQPVFNGGCNTAPIAVADEFTGKADRTASGNLLENDDYTANTEVAGYTVTNSKDGLVTIAKDGKFTFTPNEGFKGKSTSFTYKICELGISPICSEDSRVTIQFPGENEEILAQSLLDFKGFYQEDGKVEIKWATNFEQNSDRFEVERSFDGANWSTAGTLKGQGVSTSKHDYSFVDKVGKNTVHKNDLYYRLKQVNTDQKSAVSRIMVVRVFNKRSLRMVSVTPNPVKNDIAVNVQLNETSFVVMKIMSKDGNEMMRKSQNVEEGQNSFVMDGSNKLTPGLYFLEVTVNSKDRMVAKLLKE